MARLHRSRHWTALLGILVGLSAAVGSATALAQPAPPPPDEEDEPPPAEVQPPAQPPDQATFEQALSPYRHWVETPDYGRVWVPSSAANPDWQPYTDGRWTYTDSGWAFASDVPWGWAAFHYGRWGWAANTGIAREVIPRAHASTIIRSSRPAPSIVSAPERGRIYGPPRTVVRPGRGVPSRTPGPGPGHGRH